MTKSREVAAAEKAGKVDMKERQMLEAFQKIKLGEGMRSNSIQFKRGSVWGSFDNSF